MANHELSWEDLHRSCDATRLGFETTADLDPLQEVLGQPRAMAAVDFGTAMGGAG